MKLNKKIDFLEQLSKEDADRVLGGVRGPRGLIKKLENPGIDAPGLTPEKGIKIASNTNGKKKGWIEGTVPNR